jgi:hypothetical protein
MGAFEEALAALLGKDPGRAARISNRFHQIVFAVAESDHDPPGGVRADCEPARHLCR